MRLRQTVDTGGLLAKAMMTLGMTQGELAKVLGTSHRTAHRLANGRAVLMDEHLATLAARVYPKDRALAAELASAIDATLVDLKLEAPPRPPPPPPPPPAPPPVVIMQPAPPPPPRPRPAPAALIDAVVCAAAEAHGVMPDEVRAMLLAAFSRGDELGLTMEEAAVALRARLGMEGSTNLAARVTGEGADGASEVQPDAGGAAAPRTVATGRAPDKRRR
jgi:plasmid maintenance system antidote protein VapI